MTQGTNKLGASYSAISGSNIGTSTYVMIKSGGSSTAQQIGGLNVGHFKCWKFQLQYKLVNGATTAGSAFSLTDSNKSLSCNSYTAADTPSK